MSSAPGKFALIASLYVAQAVPMGFLVVAASTAATDFTLQQSLAAVGPLIGTIASGFVASAIGFVGHFLICTGLGISAVLAVSRARLAVAG